MGGTRGSFVPGSGTDPNRGGQCVGEGEGASGREGICHLARSRWAVRTSRPWHFSDFPPSGPRLNRSKSGRRRAVVNCGWRGPLMRLGNAVVIPPARPGTILRRAAPLRAAARAARLRLRQGDRFAEVGGAERLQLGGVVGDDGLLAAQGHAAHDARGDHRAAIMADGVLHYLHPSGLPSYGLQQHMGLAGRACRHLHSPIRARHGAAARPPPRSARPRTPLPPSPTPAASARGRVC